MAKKDRYLRFSNLELEVGKSIAANCNSCERVFVGKPNPGEKIDDVLLRMRAEFDVHDCHEDASNGRGRSPI